MEKYEKYRVQMPQIAPIGKYEKYRISPAKQEGDSWPALIGKSVLKGVSSIGDIPSLVGQGVEGLTNIARIDDESAELNKGRPLGFFNSNWIQKPDVTQTNYSNNLPTSSDLRRGIKNYTGVDLESHPTTPGQRIASNAAEFAGGFAVPGMGAIKAAAKAPGLFNKFAKISKIIAPAAAIGGTSGVLQEGGVDPIVADIGTSVAFPLAGASNKNLFNKFSSDHKQIKDKRRLADALKGQIGEENIPKALKNIKKYNKQKNPIKLDLTTPEVTQDTGLSRLYSSTQSNSPKFITRHQENNKKLLESLEEVGTTGLPESARGEAIRSPFVENYNKNIQNRNRLTKPLYEELESIESGLNPIKARNLLEKELAVASPGNKTQLSKYYKSLQRNEIDTVTLEKLKELKNNINLIDKEYQHLNPAAIAQMKAPLLAELEQLTSSISPRPIQIENTIQELGDKVNSLSRSGEQNVSRRFGKIKKAYEEDLATNPIGLKHREEYKRLSKPINQIETSSLLHNLVKKNRDVSKLEGFTASSEKLPNMILNADLPNTKILINKAKGNREVLDLVKGTYIDKLLELSKISGGKLSYDKANKFINNKYNKEKLDVVFNSQERKKIDQYLDTLKRRSNVESSGKFSGSDTHQKFKIEQDFNDSLDGLGKIAGKAALKATGFGGLSTVWDAGRSIFNKSKNGRYNSLLEEALIDPNAFQKLMTQPNKPKTFRDFYNPFPALITGTAVNSGRE